MNFNYCALHYLNLWLSKDRNFCEALEGHNEAVKLRALTEAAAFYRVARNLPMVYDVGKGIPRYKPVLEAIDALAPIAFQEAQLIPSNNGRRESDLTEVWSPGSHVSNHKISVAEDEKSNRYLRQPSQESTWHEPGRYPRLLLAVARAV